MTHPNPNSRTAAPVVLIAAVSENRVIGADGKIPWHLPRDLQHFQTVTTGNPVVMGRRTYDSIRQRLGHPLPDRFSIVITHSQNRVEVPNTGRVEVVTSLERALRVGSDYVQYESDAEAVYVIGGASVYEQCIEFADRLLLTEVVGEYEGDAYFPPYESDWEEVHREDHEGFSIVGYDPTTDHFGTPGE